MNLLIILVLAFTLSADVFFTLLICPLNLKSRNTYILPLIVGIMHFILPLSMYFLTKEINIDFQTMKIIPSIIFFYFGLVSIIKDDNKNIKLNGIISLILISISVSMDSGFAGVSLAFSNLNIYLCAIIFGSIAFISSYISIVIASLLKSKINNDLSLITGIIFIIISILFFMNIL